MLERRAAAPVHGNAPVAGNEADDIVGRCGFAAFGQRGQQAGFAVHQNTVFATLADFGFFDDAAFAHRLFGRVV